MAEQGDFRDSVRERIMKQFERILQGMSQANGNYVKWVNVVRSPLEEIVAEKLGGRSVALFDTTETYLYNTSMTECTLRVQVEYWYKLNQGQNASTEAERIRGDLARTLGAKSQMREADTNAVLTMSIRLASSDKDVSGPRPDYIGGLLELDVIYRHKPHDPYKLQGEQ